MCLLFHYFFPFLFFFEKGGILISIHLVNLFFRGTRKAEIHSNENLVIKEMISGSGRTELSTFVVRVTHFTDLEIRKLHLTTF
jgi:hypothetical protein